MIDPKNKQITKSRLFLDCSLLFLFGSWIYFFSSIHLEKGLGFYIEPLDWFLLPYLLFGLLLPFKTFLKRKKCTWVGLYFFSCNCLQWNFQTCNAAIIRTFSYWNVEFSCNLIFIVREKSKTQDRKKYCNRR